MTKRSKVRRKPRPITTLGGIRARCANCEIHQAAAVGTAENIGADGMGYHRGRRAREGQPVWETAVDDLYAYALNLACEIQNEHEAEMRVVDEFNFILRLEKGGA